MRSAVHSPVPSSSLLKFLKSQSEVICFFSPNPRPGFIFDHAAPRYPLPSANTLKASSIDFARCFSTTAPKRATIEAGFINLDFLWPQSLATSTFRPRQRCTPRAKKVAYENVSAMQRNSSTRAKRYSWHSWLWSRSAKKGGKPLHPDDLPMPLEDSSGSAFRMGHRISAKAAAQPKLRCTELDENGNVVLASGEFKKSELIAKVHPRNVCY
jgi:magnesium transporter